MKRTLSVLLAVFVGSVLIGGTSAPVDAGVSFGVTASPADIQVWLERADGCGNAAAYDVYPSASDVIVNVRAARSCYAALYVVDTAGFIHVIYPFSPYDNTYLVGGDVYRFYLGDFVTGGVFDRGVAYAFAVSSPFRFTFDRYGMGVFDANLGFQVYGDPYLAARSFYMSILPQSCGVGVLRVSHARFYIREYVRYPRYLCAEWHVAHGTRSYCRSDCEVYRQYRAHAADPFRALRPTVVVTASMRQYTEIMRSNRWSGDVRIKTRRTPNEDKPLAYEMPSRTRTINTEPHTTDVVVKSSKDTFVKSKKDISAKRQQLKRRNEAKTKTVAKGSRHAESTHVVAQRGSKDTGVSKKKQDVTHGRKASSKSKSSKKETKERDGSR